MNPKPTVTIWTSSHDHNGGFKKMKSLVWSSNRFEELFFVFKGSLKMFYNIARKILRHQISSWNPPNSYCIAQRQ